MRDLERVRRSRRLTASTTCRFLSRTGRFGHPGAINIQPGQTTFTEEPDSPTGNIATGQSQVTLAKFDLYASASRPRSNSLDFKIALTGVATTTGFTSLSNFLKNVSLTDDAGGQVGTTVNTPPSSGASSCSTANQGALGGLTSVTNGTIVSSTVTYPDCFGSQSSPINYIVPANTTRVLSLKADIQSMTSPATFATITASLTGDSSNLQGQISGQPAGTSQTSGNTLTLITSSLTVAQNNALAAQTIAANTTNQRISSYSFSASTAEGVNVNTVSIKLSPFAITTYFANLKLMVNGQPWGTTQPTVAAGQTYAFSGSQFNVPKGGTISVDVYADTLKCRERWRDQPGDVLDRLLRNGSGLVYTAISCSSVTGQNLTFGGATAIKIWLDGNSAAASQVAMGTTQTNLATFDFQETSNVQTFR